MNHYLLRALLVLLLLLLVVSCNTPTNLPASSSGTEESITGPNTQRPTGPTSTAEPAPPSGEKGEEWKNPYEQVKAELCGPEAESKDTPTFAEPLPVRVEQAGAVKEVWVQRGLLANEQGELFRIDVTGSSQEQVARYSGELKLCLDQRFTGQPAELQEEPLPAPAEPPLPETFGANVEDLIIEIYLVGFLAVPEEAPATLKRLTASPAEEWALLFKQFGLTPELARPEEANQSYVVDFVIDPSVSNGATHRYAEKSGVKQVVATISVANGSGSVRGTLCRNSGTLLSKTVAFSGTKTDGVSNTSAVPVTYDLGITGNSSGTYRVSGRFGVAGWSSSYLDPYVAGGSSNCPP